MSRKKFIESQRATCNNWTWSWSFINEKEKVIIFGAFDQNTEGNASLILEENWQTSEQDRKNAGYAQSREHIRLIEEEGYQLKTFPMRYSDANKDEEGNGPAKIEDFEEKLTKKSLKRVGGSWYASDDAISPLLSEEVHAPEKYLEGASKKISVNTYERNPDARSKCVEHHGHKCAICSFDFENFYGDIGKNYIHVHHIVSLSEIKKQYVLDPVKDLVPVCPNCHAIIHRTQPALGIEQLRTHLSAKRNV